ncbi:hypothetical protein D1816_07590 [Aquimarina sp. AD10]|nr:hypothetical protein D1816_07590 [Aquimarina sp. AD10]
MLKGATMYGINNIKSFSVFFMLPFIFFAQLKEESAYYNWFDTVIGQEHTGLYNGRQYIDSYINKIYENKHPFFHLDKVYKGSVTYSGQTYYDVGMKYNLNSDHLLITLKPGAMVSVLQLVHHNIQEFTIDGSRFIRIDKDIYKDVPQSKFFEVLLENPSFSLIKSHRKKKKERIENVGGNKLYYEFVSVNKYILLSKGKSEVISSKYDLFNIYPIAKKEIKQFYVKNKRLRKSQPDRFMQRLFEKIIQPIESKNQL